MSENEIAKIEPIIIDGKPLNDSEIIDKLKIDIAKALVGVGTTLSAQAGFEDARVSKQRPFISRIEEVVMADESWQDLDSREKIGLYKLISDNMKNSMDFMLELYKTLATGADFIKRIDDIHPMKKKINHADMTNKSGEEVLNKVKQVILEAIREKKAKEKADADKM